MRIWQRIGGWVARAAAATMLVWGLLVAPIHVHASVPAPAASVPAAPVEIPEPVTVILFGTGLAALAAAATFRRR